MTDKPEIKVGQRWITRGGDTVRILATDASGDCPVIAQYDDHRILQLTRAGNSFDDGEDYHTNLDRLAPSTVKREVALYQNKQTPTQWLYAAEGPAFAGDPRVSEPLTIEFTLLPGESAE